MIQMGVSVNDLGDGLIGHGPDLFDNCLAAGRIFESTSSTPWTNPYQGVTTASTDQVEIFGDPLNGLNWSKQVLQSLQHVAGPAGAPGDCEGPGAWASRPQASATKDVTEQPELPAPLSSASSVSCKRLLRPCYSYRGA